MSDQEFSAIALRADHLAEPELVQDAVDDHLSLDIEADHKTATGDETKRLHKPEPSAASAMAAAAAAAAAPLSATALALQLQEARKTKQQLQQKRESFHDMGGSGRKGGKGVDSSTRRKQRIWNASLLTVYALTVLVCWGTVSPAWVRLRENVVTPIAQLDPTDDGDRVFANSFTSVGGVMVVIGYLPLTILVSGCVYFTTCLLPQCGPRWLPWNWHNETVYLANYRMECNPTYWIWTAWSSSIGAILAGILLQQHDEFLLLCLAVLCSDSAHLLASTEQENSGSPNKDKDKSAFWRAFVPTIVKYIVLYRAYHSAVSATLADGTPFHFNPLVFVAGLMYLLPELVHLILVAARLWECCGMDSYPQFATWTRAVSALSQWTMCVIVFALLHILV